MEEDIEVLYKIVKEYYTINQDVEYTEQFGEEGVCLYFKGIKSLENVLNALEQKDNEILQYKKGVKKLAIRRKKYKNKYFKTKCKIREKIEEIKNRPNNSKQKVSACQIDAALINILQELLEG